MTALLDATIVIVTHNRRDDLRTALRSACSQLGSIEVLVLDDASTDGTEAMVRKEFPHVRYDRVERGVGYIVHRNRAADLARGRVLVSIDDDAEFSSPRTVEQTLQDFDDPRIGAVAIPFIDVRQGERQRQFPPDSTGTWIGARFIGTAYAVDREAFISVGRFRESFRHQGEEVDYCIRQIEHGLVTRLGRADPILHHESPKRVRAYILEQTVRNTICTILLNYPATTVPWAMTRSCTGLGLAAFKRRMPVAGVRGFARGFWYAATHLNQRRPVRRATLTTYLRLWREGPKDIESVLPAAAKAVAPAGAQSPTTA